MSVDISFWNVRGINDNKKHPAFSHWLISNKITIGAILETHIKESNLTRIMASLCPWWSFVSNHSEDEDGRIIIFWTSPAAVTVMHKTRQSCSVTYPGIPTFIMTAVYTDNTVEERKILRNTLLEEKDNVFSITLLGSWEETSMRLSTQQNILPLLSTAHLRK